MWIEILALIVSIAAFVIAYLEFKRNFINKDIKSGKIQSLKPPNKRVLHYITRPDKDGLDIFSRVFYAARIDLGIAISSTAIAFSLGILLGVLGGYFVGGGGLIGVIAEWMMRAVDVIQSFPVFIFALALVAALGASALNIIVAMVFVNTPVFIWLTRSEVLSVRQKPFIEGARCSGNSEIRIAMRHILPNSLAAALTQLSVVIGFSILLTASISFIGAGIRVPTPEWGLMVSQGASTMITGQWWVALFPGLALASSVLGFALLGDGFRNFIDPKRRVAGYGKKVKKQPPLSKGLDGKDK